MDHAIQKSDLILYIQNFCMIHRSTIYYILYTIYILALRAGKVGARRCVRGKLGQSEANLFAK